MATLKIEIPNDSCKNCPYLKIQTVDHNYYGEISTFHVCSVFNSKITGYNKCSECIACSVESENDIRKYADFLVKEINQMLEEAYCNGITDFEKTLKPCVTRPNVIEHIACELRERSKA